MLSTSSLLWLTRSASLLLIQPLKSCVDVVVVVVVPVVAVDVVAVVVVVEVGELRESGFQIWCGSRCRWTPSWSPSSHSRHGCNRCFDLKEKINKVKRESIPNAFKYHQ